MYNFRVGTTFDLNFILTLAFKEKNNNFLFNNLNEQEIKNVILKSIYSNQIIIAENYKREDVGLICSLNFIELESIISLDKIIKNNISQKEKYSYTYFFHVLSNKLPETLIKDLFQVNEGQIISKNIVKNLISIKKENEEYINILEEKKYCLTELSFSSEDLLFSKKII